MLNWDRWQVRLARRSGRVRCPPGWSLPEEWSLRLRDFDLWFVWAGRGRMITRQGALELRPGIGIWARPGGLYLAEQDPHNRLGVTFIHFELCDHAGRMLPYAGALPAEVHDVVDVHYVDAVMRRIVELNREPAPNLPAATALLTGLLRDLDAQAARPASARPAGAERHHREVVHKLAARMDEYPGAVPPVAELARSCGYSPDHFARVFKAVLGLTPRDYALQARIERARHLLAESPLSVTQIAQELGYSDVYFFSKQFKEKTGRAPTAFRRGQA